MSHRSLNDADLAILKKLHIKETFSSDEAATLRGIFARAVGNMDVNRTISALSLDKNYAYLSSTTVNFIRDLSYRTRHLDKIRPRIDSIWNDFERSMNSKTQGLNDKISLEEYGILYDLSALHASLHEEYERDLIEDSPVLEALYEYTRRAKIMITYLDSQFAREFTFPIGSVVVSDIEKKDRIYGEKPTAIEKFCVFLLRNFVTKFGHAAKGISVGETHRPVNKMSHIDGIDGKYKEETFSLRSFLYSEVYRIKLDALIDEQSKALLKENYGEDWLKKVEQIFSAIERSLHDNARDKHVDRVVNISPEVATSIATVKLQGGHKNKFCFHHLNEDIRNQVFEKELRANQNNSNSSSLLCSEFIGMTIIASIQELNNLIKADLVEKGVSKIPAKLIKSPISKREKLHLLTPERLIRAMDKRGALELIPDESLTSKYITKDIKSRLKTIKIEDDGNLTSLDDLNPTL